MCDHDCKILDYDIKYESKEHNYTRVEFNKETNCLLVTFDYLNSKEGFIIKVVHDYRKANCFNIKAAFKGSPDLKFSNEQPKTFDSIESLTIMIGFLVVIILPSKGISHELSIIISLTYVATTIIVFIRYYFYRRKKIIPKNLRTKLYT